MQIYPFTCIFTLTLLQYGETTSEYHPGKLPATPLIVRTPYLSTWLTSPTKTLYGAWPTFWNGNSVKGMAGLVRVDGTTYEFMGHPTQDPIGTTRQVEQKSLNYTSTQSIFTLIAGKIELTINFLSPVEPKDLKLMSIPASYVFAETKSLDGASHRVQIYMDISAEWIGGDSSEIATWSMDEVNYEGGTLLFHNVQLQNQKQFVEVNDQAEWGTMKLFTRGSELTTFQSGPSITVRSGFVANGKLSNSQDTRFRAINDQWPVFAFASDLSTLTSVSRIVIYGLAHIRHPAINYTTGPVNSLWEDAFHDWKEMLSFFYADAFGVKYRVNGLDESIAKSASAVGGSDYAAIVSAALRQAYGGIELVGTLANPWLMLKEISSDGNCQTVDVLYPHFPVQHVLNPTLIKYLLNPLFAEQEAGYYPRKYSMHDLGSHYPNCTGHPTGDDEAMEVEESANMIIMTAAYVKDTKDNAYARQHYKILKQWAQYLVDNGLFPGNALTTDDFLGRINNATNLSVKAIVGIAAMAQLAAASGNSLDASYYRNISLKYIKTWQLYAQDSSGKHLKLGYGLDGSWAMVYNFYADKLLGTNLIRKEITDEQDIWYLQVAQEYGVPLESGQQGKPSTWAKVDWEMFAAGASNSPYVRHVLFHSLALWLNETTSLAPFSDWIDVVAGTSPGFTNRPVIGGVFAALPFLIEN